MPAAIASAARILLCTLVTFIPARAVAQEPSFGQRIISCPGGWTRPWSKAEPPSVAEMTVECARLPNILAQPVTPEEMSKAVEALRRADEREASDKRRAAELETQHVLDGKFGQIAAFSTAWRLGRRAIYMRYLGQWSAYVGGFFAVCYLLFGRKRA